MKMKIEVTLAMPSAGVDVSRSFPPRGALASAESRVANVASEQEKCEFWLP
jgi:hypothetical protein